MLTEQILKQLWPHGDDKVPGLRAGIVASAPAVFAKYGLTTPLLVAHAMAQFSHECGAGTEMEENMNYSASRIAEVWPSRPSAVQFAHNPRALANNVYGSRMGNHAGTDDGFNFRGRGLSQTTGREGYQKLATKTGLDLLNHPELVNAPAAALECAVADFIICGCLPYAAKDDVREVTHRLNGGYIGLPERQAWLAKWKKALGTAPVASIAVPAPKVSTETKAAGGIVAGGVVAAQQAHSNGFGAGKIVLIFVVFIAVAAMAWLAVRHFKKPVPVPVVSPIEPAAPAAPIAPQQDQQPPPPAS